MKHFAKILVFLLLSGIIFFLPKTAYAAKCGSINTAIIECSENEEEIFNDVLSDTIEILSIGIGIVGVIGIMIAGIQYLLSKDNEQQASKAKSRLKNVAIGLACYAIIFAALSWLLPGFSTEVHLPKNSSTSSDNPQSNTGTSSNQSGNNTPQANNNTPSTSNSTSGTNGSTPASSTSKTNAKTTDYLKFGSALAIIHADYSGSINKIKKAVDKHYWAAECDLHYTNGKLSCYHDASHLSQGKSSTLAKTVSVCKAGNTKILLDVKDTSDACAKNLATYIKKNNLKNDVIIMTNNMTFIKKVNQLTGTKQNYWGLGISKQSTIDALVSNAKTYKSLGMTTVHISKDDKNKHRIGTEKNIKKLQKAGYKVSVYTFDKFSKKEITKYTNYGAKYLMTDNINQQ